MTGAVAAAWRAHAGTTLNVTLSAAATVRFTVIRLTQGVRRSGACKPAGRASGGQRCTIRRTIHSFSRPLRPAANAVPYSGRYRSGGRTRSLAAGSYRIEATVVSSAGAAGTARGRSVTVVR